MLVDQIVTIGALNPISVLSCSSSEIEGLKGELKTRKDHVTYVADIEGRQLKTRDDVFTQLSQAFHFPEYFGRNWHAVDDCLGDLDWIEAQGYLLLIKDSELLPLDTDTLFDLLRTLFYAGLDWKTGDVVKCVGEERSAPFYSLFHTASDPDPLITRLRNLMPEIQVLDERD